MRNKQVKTKELKNILLIMLILLPLVIFTLAVTVRTYLKENPGQINTKHIEITKRTDDTIVLEWPETRNAQKYIVHYKKTGKVFEHWNQKEVHGESINLLKLEQGTQYSVYIIAYDDDGAGLESDIFRVTTRRRALDSIPKIVTKSIDGKDFNFCPETGAKVNYNSKDDKIASVDSNGRLSIKGKGQTEITISTEEDDNFVAEKKVVSVLILDTTPGKSIKTLYELNENNCKKIISITGKDGASVPQSFGYTGKEYIISYGMYGDQRTVIYDIATGEKHTDKPTVALIHPNGSTYCPETGLYYIVRGWSGRAVTYNPKTGKYGEMNFRNGLSGIAYDRITKQFYGSSRTGTSVYDVDYKLQKVIPNVNHSSQMSTQDCGGHDGIAMRCLSPKSNIHGTNYIDLYDVENGTYIGSFKCELSEVESVAVDNEGYLLVLSNYGSSTDCIWKAPIRIEGLLD